MDRFVKLFTIGVFLVLASWGVKQLFASLAIFGLGGMLDEEATKASEYAEIADETIDNRLRIAEEERKRSPDNELIDRLETENRRTRNRIQEEYMLARIEASADSKSSASTALSMLQWFLWLKVLLDLLKIAGVFLMVRGTLGFIGDEEVSPQLRWFGMAASTAVLASVLLGGLFTFVS